MYREMAYSLVSTQYTITVHVCIDLHIYFLCADALQPIRQLRLAHNLDPPLSDRQIDLSKIPDGVLGE